MDDERIARELTELAEALHIAPTPDATADEVVAYACRELGADYAGITLIRGRNRLETLAPTHPVVKEVDTLQYELEEGTCRDSSWSGRTLVSQDLADDPRWPRWGPKAAALGVSSAIASELTHTEGRRLGAVNLYWSRPQEFTADDIAFASLFGRHVAVALSVSLEVAGLNVALDARKLIGQAQGILMERHNLGQDRAFEVLKRYSQDNNLKLRLVAEYLVSNRSLPRGGGASEERPGAR